MAFVRRRTTTSGGLFTTPGVCTTLIESYRDTSGRPRQRILANLYREATPLEALAKLAAQFQLGVGPNSFDNHNMWY